MRNVLCVFVALGLAACGTHNVSCTETPTDPLCAAPDSGLDGGPGDTAIDSPMPCGGSCMAPTPHCLAATNTCVGCTGDGDCGTAAPHCEPTSHTCVACLGEADCSGSGQHCDVPHNTCEDCLTNTHCTDPGMSLCDITAHTCGACGANADCAHLTSTPVCDPGGTCVGCLSNADCDATHGCESATSSCVTFTATSANPCEPCVRDGQCQPGQLCVAMTSHGTAIGSFCTWREDAAGSGAPNGDCAMVAPYANTVSATSVDGVATMVCGLVVSSCPALTDFRTGGASATSQCTGPTTGVTDDPDCGATGVADGFCRIDSGSHHYCTVECSTMSDCPCTGGTCTAHYPCSGGFCSLNP